MKIGEWKAWETGACSISNPMMYRTAAKVAEGAHNYYGRKYRLQLFAQLVYCNCLAQTDPRGWLSFGARSLDLMTLLHSTRLHVQSRLHWNRELARCLRAKACWVVQSAKHPVWYCIFLTSALAARQAC